VLPKNADDILNMVSKSIQFNANLRKHKNMKNPFTLLFLLATTVSIHAQTVANFENLEVMTDEFLNGSDLNGGFASGNIFLPNNYNESYQSWIGWAISATTDTATPGFNNQYSAITGEGAEGSTTYAVNFAFGPNIIKLSDEARGAAVNGLYLTNSTYAYLSMRDGDAFAKRFGGETGDDPDFFRLTIKKYYEGVLGIDSIDFYLADYRFDDNAEDYLVDAWRWIDLSSLGDCDSLWFSLGSSDNGQFGMNTPAFFCIDNVTTEDISTGVSKVNEALKFDVFPNPTADVTHLTWNHEEAELFLVNSRGVVVSRQTLTEGANEVSFNSQSSGTYYLKAVTKNGIFTKTIIHTRSR
jgi:uncharacterized protein DUF4465/type IX secretion system substrate protein